MLLKTPRVNEEKHLQRMGLRRLSEDDVPHLDDIETDWHRGVADAGVSRALLHTSCSTSP